MKAPIIEYDAYLIQPGTDLALSGVGTPTVTAAYGDYGGVGEIMSLKARCSITVSYTNIKWKANNDGSITVTGNIAPVILKRAATGASSTNRQHIKAWFNDQVIFDETVNTGSSGEYNLNVPSTFSVNIPASFTPQKAYPAAVHVLNDNANSSTNVPDEYALGILITNFNKPYYRPGMVLDNGKVYQSHNRPTGDARIFNGGTWSWEELSTNNGAVGTDNPPLIQFTDNARNMRKIGAGKDD